MLIRLLHVVRMAVSVFFALIVVSLCALWMRSYWRRDVVRWESQNSSFMAVHRLGRTYWSVSAKRAAHPSQLHHQLHPAWEYETAPAGERDEFSAEPILFWGRYSTVTRAYAPHWFYVSIASMLAALSWMLRRFTVRRMLAFTALVAAFCTAVANTG